MTRGKGTDTTQGEDDSQEMVVSFVEHGGKKVNDDHEGNSDLLCICKQCEDTFKR